MLINGLVLLLFLHVVDHIVIHCWFSIDLFNMLSLLLELIQSLLSKLIKFVLVHLTHLLNSLVLLLPNIAQLLIDRLVHILHDPGFTFLNLIVDLSHSLVLLKV